jgi:hypothetical protein
MTSIVSLNRMLANSNCSARKTNPTQPSRLKNIEVAHKLSLQLYRRRKGSQRTSICTKNMENTIKMQSLQIMMKSNLQLSSLISLENI